ncbi:hypothetical protein U1Q18_002699 [Sarracenia purpurea var. burkii]
MASPAWLPPEMQTPTSQSSSSAPGPLVSGGPSTPNASPAPVVVSTPPSTSNGRTGSTGDSGQESSEQEKFVATIGHVAPTRPPSPSFSYNVLPNVSTTSGSSQLSSSSPAIESKSPAASSAFLQSLVPGLSGSNSPSFSYNILNGGVGIHSSHQSQSSTPVGPQGGKNTLPAAASLQPPVPGLPNSFLPGTAAQLMPPPAPSSVCTPKGVSPNPESRALGSQKSRWKRSRGTGSQGSPWGAEDWGGVQGVDGLLAIVRVTQQALHVID